MCNNIPAINTNNPKHINPNKTHQLPIKPPTSDATIAPNNPPYVAFGAINPNAVAPAHTAIKPRNILYSGAYSDSQFIAIDTPHRIIPSIKNAAGTQPII